MKTIKKLVKKLSKTVAFGNILIFIFSLFNLKKYKERIIKIQTEEKFFRSINYNNTILEGPFKGMIYPTLESTCSEMAPKILGSYEEELFEAIAEISKKKYSNAFNIGCADGYYSVGLCLKIPNMRMYAFDINKKALEMCKKLASYNNVNDRISYMGFCSENNIKEFDFGKKGLIICDCEGYEKELFTQESIKNLNKCDLLIELHDIILPGISETILPLFTKTHTLTIIKSKNRNPVKYPLLQIFSELDKKTILSEYRDGLYGETTMEWAYLVANEN